MNAGLILKVRSLQNYKRISHGRRKDNQEFKRIVSIVTSYACSTKQKTISLGDLRFLWTWTPHWVIFQHPFSTHSFSRCRGENCNRVPKRSAPYIITHWQALVLSTMLRAMGRPLNTVTSLELERDFERDWGWQYDGYALVRWPGRMFLEICRRLNCRFYSCTNNLKKFHYGFFFDFNFQNSLYLY